jgi:hypothetical protein
MDTSPVPLSGSGSVRTVSFGADGELVFRSLAEDNVPVRIKMDGTGRERLAVGSVLDKYGVSPDGEWVIVVCCPSGGAGEKALKATLAVPTHGGAPKKICGPPFCQAVWSSDGRFLYVTGYHQGTPGKMLAIPVPAGKSLPDLPASGIDLSAGEIEPPGTQVLEHGSLSPGLTLQPMSSQRRTCSAIFFGYPCIDRPQLACPAASAKRWLRTNVRGWRDPLSVTSD